MYSWFLVFQICIFLIAKLTSVNTPPQIGVKISRIYNFLEQKGKSVFSSSFCLMKCLSTYMYLVRSYWIGLLFMAIAALLSQYILISVSIGYPSSSNNLFIHSTSHNSLVIPLNSALALDRATSFCLLLFKVTKSPPIKIKYPEVDFLSIRFLA